MKRIGALAMIIAGCAPPPPSSSRGGEDDRAVVELDAIPQLPSAGACSGGRWGCYAQVRTGGDGHVQPFASPQGLGPADLASAYRLDPARGAGATIAIVDAYAYPDADKDLAVYRKKLGLPPCTKASGCLRVVNQDGKGTPMPAAPPAGDDWTVEAALDLDAASAACPKCKLLLVLADDDRGDGLFAANDTAAALGATVVSSSWGGPDDGSSASLEHHFAHAGVGYFVAGGDQGNTGARPDYPSTSAHVTAVGGTSLVRSRSGARGWTEGAWSGAGSSCSRTIAKPSFQAKASTACGKRAASDVAAVADPNTGLAVYNARAGGWIVVGGTSAACPIVAAIYAATGHGASGPSYAYAHPTAYFDVTAGKNGSCSNALCHARAGWDGPTGVGAPDGAVLAGTCTPSCTGRSCGGDGCGGTCGACSAGASCTAGGKCERAACTPACAGRACGDDGCGGTCGTCAGGAMCDPSGACAGGGECVHEVCSTGAALDGACDGCAGAICAADPYCCDGTWDAACVGEVASECGASCGGGASGACAHDECATGVALDASCDACAAEVCAADAYCCGTSWDSTCVGEIGILCGDSCD
jgi:hypothetical protein